MQRHDRSLILASTSAHRQRLLTRLRVDYSVRSPGVDEAALSGEKPHQLACRLARAKAKAVAQGQPSAWVIGSDQVASLRGSLLGKPGNVERASQQLHACSGQTVIFYTAVALQCIEAGYDELRLQEITVQFRALDSHEIDRYLASEPSLDCAGSFKIEGLGVSLFERVSSDDPTALEGLPLIALCDLLRQAGFRLP